MTTFVARLVRDANLEPMDRQCFPFGMVPGTLGQRQHPVNKQIPCIVGVRVKVRVIVSAVVSPTTSLVTHQQRIKTMECAVTVIARLTNRHSSRGAALPGK
mmetsp:Transcript_118652/g.206626  ORF Transcript_118652/g.206626 Transcript_118652/m.206626 type:complete len:101 (-) Transcript_118652:110-412(-)